MTGNYNLLLSYQTDYPQDRMSKNKTIAVAPDDVQPPQASASTNSAIRASDEECQEIGSKSSRDEFPTRKFPVQVRRVSPGREIRKPQTLRTRLASAVDAATEAIEPCRCEDRDVFTYFVAGAGKIKIGKSRDPRTRLADLQIGSPVPLTLRFIAHGDIEQRLHDRYRDHHSHGEWFDERGVLHELRIPIARARVHCVCLAAAMRMEPRDTERVLLRMTCLPVRWIECTRWHTPPFAWFTARGEVFTESGWYHKPSGMRALWSVRASKGWSAVQLAEHIAKPYDNEPIPDWTAEGMRKWMAGCVTCAIMDGACVPNDNDRLIRNMCPEAFQKTPRSDRP